MSSMAELSDAKRRLLEKMLAGARPGEAEIARRSAGEIPPISAEQMNVWVHMAMAPGQPLYNEAITIHRRGSFDHAALEAAFNEILRRHEIWRTSFVAMDGRPRQIVHPELRLSLPLIDLTPLPPEEREAEAIRLATIEARKPFDLEQGPLLRGIVVRIAADDHRLHLALHHIIFDGVAIYSIIVPELAAFYDAFSRGSQPSLPEPRLQYGDYACWREQELQTRPLTRELAYWRCNLGGELPVLQLPADRPRPPTPSYRGSMETFRLAPALTVALKELSRSEGVTLYATLLAAFKALLHRYSGQEDILIGGVTDIRRRPELAGVVGYFLNGVALRTRPTPDASFRDYLRAVQDTVLGALDASAVPFDRVVREVQPKRDLARHALFQVMFSIQPPVPDYGPGWDLTQMDVSVGAAKFDLYLELEEHGETIIGRFLYSTDLFDAPFIRRMIGHWRCLLEGAVADPNCALGALPLMTRDEARTLLVDWNATEVPLPATTLDRWFEAQAALMPDAPAVECAGTCWTYGELDRRAGRLARRLRDAGVGPEIVVAVALERSLAMVTALLAIHKAGGAHLPIDPDLPPARIAFLLNDARPLVLLTESAVQSRLPATTMRILLTDDSASERDERIEMRDIETRDLAVDGDRLALVLYTSGSMGQPKAVEITQRALLNVLVAMQRKPGFSAADSFLAVTTLSFDIATAELFLPLVSGGKLVIARRDEAIDPVRLAALLQRSACTVMFATPTTWRGLLQAGWSGDGKLKILCGGEALSRDLADRLLPCCESLWNIYGPTETTIYSACHRVAPDGASVPIGRPIANTRLYVLDPRGNPVPVGVPGELCIAGAGVARGYRNDPALTSSRFVTKAALEDARIYCTGDRVRYRADGVLECLGRTDNQVKIRGCRVGIEEVEAAIAQHPDVAAAAVRAWPDASGELTLVAYLRLAGGDNAIAALRRFLRDHLPEYMVPSRFVPLAELPLTATGKLDRKRLPPPEAVSAPVSATPRDDLEGKLLEIWSKLLGRSDFGVHDSFFDLGGHSLLAFMMVSEIQKLTGRELPLATLFRRPTIADLAELLRSGELPPFSHLVALKRHGMGRPLFLIHAVFGNVLHLRELAEHLRTERPIYALQARGVDPQQEPHRTLAEMAEAYIATIRGVQPAGPYALAGYSMGGLIAYEMACRLRERGETVELLALIDAVLHPRNFPLGAWLHHNWRAARRILGRLAHTHFSRWPAYVWSKVDLIWNRTLLRFGLGKISDPPVAITGHLTERYREMYRIGVREFTAFKPRPYDGRIIYFRAVERGTDPDSLPAWQRLAAEIETYMIDGQHLTILTDRQLQAVAHQLSECLAALDRPPPRGTETPEKNDRSPPSGPPRSRWSRRVVLDALARRKVLVATAAVAGKLDEA